MTNQELKEWAEIQPRGKVEQAILALLAKEAQRGEVVRACIYCGLVRDEKYLEPPSKDWAQWRCRRCGRWFPEPAYFQRVSKPDPAPEEPTT